jgi:hypothetical protein
LRSILRKQVENYTFHSLNLYFKIS